MGRFPSWRYVYPDTKQRQTKEILTKSEKQLRRINRSRLQDGDLHPTREGGLLTSRGGAVLPDSRASPEAEAGFYKARIRALVAMEDNIHRDFLRRKTEAGQAFDKAAAVLLRLSRNDGRVKKLFALLLSLYLPTYCFCWLVASWPVELVVV